jgi:hypothetical protein
MSAAADAAVRWRTRGPARAAPTPGFLQFGRCLAGRVRFTVGHNRFALGGLLTNLSSSVLEPNLKKKNLLNYPKEVIQTEKLISNS